MECPRIRFIDLDSDRNYKKTDRRNSNAGATGAAVAATRRVVAAAVDGVGRRGTRGCRHDGRHGRHARRGYGRHARGYGELVDFLCVLKSSAGAHFNLIITNTLSDSGLSRVPHKRTMARWRVAGRDGARREAADAGADGRGWDAGREDAAHARRRDGWEWADGFLAHGDARAQIKRPPGQPCRPGKIEQRGGDRHDEERDARRRSGTRRRDDEDDAYDEKDDSKGQKKSPRQSVLSDRVVSCWVGMVVFLLDFSSSIWRTPRFLMRTKSSTDLPPPHTHLFFPINNK